MLEMLARNKHSSLLQKFVSNEQKCFITLGPTLVFVAKAGSLHLEWRSASKKVSKQTEKQTDINKTNTKADRHKSKERDKKTD
jgi:hypothetical protein